MAKWFRRVKKLVRSGARAAGRALKKRYVSRGGLRVGRIAKDVQFLKSIINAEKKRVVFSTTTSLVGQVSGNSTGAYSVDMTPIPAEGVTLSTRNGSSIKLSSTWFRFQFYGMANTAQKIKGKIWIVQVMGTPQTASTALGQMFNTSMSGVIDYNSNFDPDYRGQYKILRCKPFTIQSDSVSGLTQIQDVTFGIRYNRGKGHHVRYNDDTTTLSNGQLLIFITADSGNTNGVTASTQPVPITGVNTGLVFNQYHINYYFDN